jgi:hypothetical protein
MIIRTSVPTYDYKLDCDVRYSFNYRMQPSKMDKELQVT